MSIYPYISDSKCKNCQGKITIKRSRDKNNEFCSTSCVGKFRKKSDEFTSCKFCGKEFKKTNKSKNIFCSKICSNKNKKVCYERTCKRCGKEFTSNNIANIKRGKDIYCSISCSSRKYKIDENFFNRIDNQVKAYVLGFIYSDGCLSKNGSEIIIKLHHKDFDILQRIKKEMASDHPINELNSYKNRQVSFRFSSKLIYQDLIKLGLKPAKTFIIEFPQIENNLIRHFIRGYFDGDGCLSKIGKNKKLNLYNIFTASGKFKDSLCEILNFENIEYKVYERDSGFSINIGKKESTQRFHEYIYTNSEIHMNRKYEKYFNESQTKEYINNIN